MKLKTTAALFCLSLAFAPSAMRANPELQDVFGSAIIEKAATKSADGVTVSGTSGVAGDGILTLPSGWKRLQLSFSPQSGSASHIKNAIGVTLGFFDSQSGAENADEAPISGVSVEMRQLHSRMKSSEPNAKVVILGPEGKEEASTEILVEGADAWFPLYAERKGATAFRVVVERASVNSNSGKVVVTDPSGMEAVTETISFPKTPDAVRIRIGSEVPEGQSLAVRFTELVVE